MRVITFTGKGDVGKTSISAATAVRLSDMGLRTLIMSTDPAHSLSDSFEQKLNSEPSHVKQNLWAIEVNAYDDLKKNWHAVQAYYSRLLTVQGIPPIMADEMTVLPGMEELFSLMRVKRYKEMGKYDALILDTAPTGETLRLLSLPEAMNWGVKLARTVEKFVLKPVARPLSKMSDKFAHVVPSEEVMQSIDVLFEELDGVKEILTDAQTASVRLVMNPEKMVIKETMRALTYLNLYGFKVDMVTVNKLLAEDEDSGYLEKMEESSASLSQ
jgi:arsenite-transporting ATPase